MGCQRIPIGVKRPLEASGLLKAKSAIEMGAVPRRGHVPRSLLGSIQWEGAAGLSGIVAEQ